MLPKPSLDYSSIDLIPCTVMIARLGGYLHHDVTVWQLGCSPNHSNEGRKDLTKSPRTGRQASPSLPGRPR